MRFAAVLLGLLIAGPALADISPTSPALWPVLRSAIAGCRALGERSQTAKTSAAATANRLDTLAYLQTVAQPYYGVSLTRIGGTTKATYTGPSAAGTQLTQATGTWGFDTRHGYSKRQPWNADETLFIMENPGTTYDSTNTSGKASGAVNNAGRSIVILNASDNYSVTNYFQCGGTVKYRDERWLKMNPDWVLALIQNTDSGASGGDSASFSGDSMVVVNVKTCARISGVTLDLKSLYIGAGEGTMARDSVGNEYVMVFSNRYNNNPSVAQTAQIIKVAYGTGTVTKGAVFSAPRCSLYMEAAAAPRDSMEDCDWGHAQMSARGYYAIFHYSDNAFGGASATTSANATDGYGADQYRVFPVNLSTLAIGPNPVIYKSTVEGCDIRGKSPEGPMWRNSGGTWWSYGWGRGLNHPDVAYDTFRGREVVVGGRRCGNYNGAGRGRVEMFDLADGTMSFLSDSTGSSSPNTEAPVHHVSARASDSPYVFVTHQLQGAGNVRDNELVVYSLQSRSGSHALRIAQTHTKASTYRAEAHPAPSWSGRKVVFNSTWRTSCVACMPLSDGTAKLWQYKDYLADLSRTCLP